nr:hypothetical protein [Tanacetum cinerariifolium]GFA19686.1 hypothetical protein [Tanacetum cinerariifolium]
ELGEYINTPSWNRHAFYNYDDDNDEDYTIAITPILSTEDPVDSLIMEDEHLDTIPATKSDDVIKSSVKYLVPIPSESEGILDNMCDVPFRDNSSPLDISKDQSLILTMILLRLMTIISLLATSIMLRHRLLIMSTIVMEDILGEPRVHMPNFLPTYPTLYLDSNFTPSDNSLPESEIFCFDIEEKNSGSTTIHADISLSDLECFYFKSEPDLGDLTSIIDHEIRENILKTRACGFILRSLDLLILSFILEIQYPNLID